MSFDYIRKSYGVDVQADDRVEYTGASSPRRGTVTGADGAHLLIRLDGDLHARRYHPTWELKVLPRPAAQPDGGKDA